MRDDLLVQLQEWHEEDEFQEIVDAIQAIPVEERDYELVNHLGRALNNLERYEEAVEQFLTVAKRAQVTHSGIIGLDWLIIISSNMRMRYKRSKERMNWTLRMKIRWSFWNGFEVKWRRNPQRNP